MDIYRLLKSENIFTLMETEAYQRDDGGSVGGLASPPPHSLLRDAVPPHLQNKVVHNQNASSCYFNILLAPYGEPTVISLLSL